MRRLLRVALAFALPMAAGAVATPSDGNVLTTGAKGGAVTAVRHGAPAVALQASTAGTFSSRLFDAWS